ncbi:MAG: DUF2760 domain-containing protein [Opitutaceae bacterium]
MKKSFLIIGALVVLALSVLSLLPALEAQAAFLSYGIIATAVFLCIASCKLSCSPEVAPPAPEEPAAVEPPKMAEIPKQSSEVQVAQLLGLLQEKGRFLDFVMDDVKNYSDAQIAAAARFVHQGCQDVMKRHFSLEPISEQPENQSITLDADYQRSAFRLTGKIEGSPPFSGVVKHKGWKTTSVTLPKVMGERAQSEGEHVLAAAEVEVG